MQVRRYDSSYSQRIAAIALFFAGGSADAATIEFVEVGAAQFAGSHTAFGMTTGLAAADFDDDGDVDVFLPTAGGEPNRLFVNDGKGLFIDQASDVGLASYVSARSALWFDYDGDHDLDLAVAGDCWPDGSISVQSNVATDQVLTISHAGFGDLDADNDIDLRDYAAMQQCFAGAWFSADQTCRPADFDGDTDCDPLEAATFINRVTGPN